MICIKKEEPWFLFFIYDNNKYTANGICLVI